MENFSNLAAGLFDGILVLILLILAWQVLRSPDLFKAIVLFIVFGLMMSLAWVRLKAVDIALAEAAIGAGLTGALFFRALGRLQSRGVNDRKAKDAHGSTLEEKSGIPTGASHKDLKT
jgi:uncharacterized MnhB-related membrane protein